MMDEHKPVREYKFRCDCPITSAVDVLGDKWILVIVKQMLVQGKLTYKDFIESDEAISTNILSTKLKAMECVGIINKENHPHNRKTHLYILTEMGLALAPIIIDLVLWSDQYLREMNTDMKFSSKLDLMRTDKAAFVQHIQQQYRSHVADVLHRQF